MTCHAIATSPEKQWNTPLGAGIPAVRSRDLCAPCGIGRDFFLHDPERVVDGFARMDHDRKVPPPGDLDLRPEHSLLHVAGREVVVVIEPDLADRDHFRMPAQFFDLAECPCQSAFFASWGWMPTHA